MAEGPSPFSANQLIANLIDKTRGNVIQKISRNRTGTEKSNRSAVAVA